MDHSSLMHRCLDLAERGRGLVGVNPMVGAVLVRDGSILAEAWHTGWGKAHAERELLEAYEGPVKGDETLYVNLEPCCHAGKTPPCTDIILEMGIKHVVYGMRDPNPQVGGQGIERLRKAGVDVIGPVERARCEWLNRGFIRLQTIHRPWITLKNARTRNGEFANSAARLKITGPEQDAWSHAWLRAKHDAILVGAGTIALDNPLLNTRFVQYSEDRSDQNDGMDAPESNKKVDRNISHPLRLILNPSLSISSASKVLSPDLAAGTIIIVTPEAAESAKAQEIRTRGVRMLPVSHDGEHFEWAALWRTLTTPAADFQGITSILIEGGPKTWKSFRDAGMADAEVTLVGV